MGSTAQRVVQIGRESTWGVDVAAAAILSGVTNFTTTPRFVNTPIRVLAGSFSPAIKSVQTYRGGDAAISGYYSPQDFLYIADSGIRGSVTPTGTNPYTWTYVFQTTTAGFVRSRTIEFFDGTFTWELHGGLVSSFTLSGETTEDGLVMFESEWLSKDVIPGSLTGALAPRAFDPIPASNIRLFVDAFGGTIGTTEQGSTLISWSLECNTGLHRKKFATGTLTSDAFGYNVPELTLTLVLEQNASSQTMLDNYVNNVLNLIELRGAGASPSEVRVQMACIPSSVAPIWGDRDGNTTVELTYFPIYDPGPFAAYAKIVNVNAVSALVTGA